MTSSQNDSGNKNNLKSYNSCTINLSAKKKSFWLHLFNWKYYILPIGFGIFLGIEPSLEDKSTKIIFLLFLLVIFQTKNFQSTILKKILMFFTSFISIVFIMEIVSIFTLILNTALEKDTSNYNDIYIQTMLSSNQELPIKINKELELFQYTSSTNNSITEHVRFLNYTKNEILKETGHNLNSFKKTMLNTEKQTDCNQKSFLKMLSHNLILKISYYDKNKKFISQIQLDKNLCN